MNSNIMLCYFLVEPQPPLSSPIVSNLTSNIGSANSLSSSPSSNAAVPQMVLTSGQISLGAQIAQLMIPTSQGNEKKAIRQ